VNFEDEQYVRLYTRKTITSKRLGWEGRTVLWHLMCEADRAGIILVGDGPLDEALGVLLVDLPEDVIKAAIPRLESQGVTKRHGNKLLLVRFQEAQEAKRSDKVRAKECRDRRRAEIVTSRDEGDTQRDDGSRSVTGRHETSLSALHCSAVQSSESVAAPPPAPVQPKPALRRVDPLAASFGQPSPIERHAFAQASKAFGKTGVTFDSKRAACLADRVADGMTTQDADDAIAGALADTWINGQKDGQRRTKLTIIFGDVERFEELRDAGKALRERPSGIIRAAPSVADRIAADRAKVNADRKARGLPPVDDDSKAVRDPAAIAKILEGIG
jgi:hypothetical protein